VIRIVRPFSGSFFVRSEKSWTDELRRPGLVGLYILMVMLLSFV
jgi:hypothetical protein